MMIGETKLGYTITEMIGAGGFGTVYKAVKKNKAMETVRALKHISLPSRKQWTDIYNSMGNDVARTDQYFDTILQEILNEIRILADLTSKGVKNVVWYYENEIEDTPSPKHYDIYLLMEYLTALPSYIETHEVKVKDVIKVGTDILSALIECHKSKIIHRDIKTDNIFISEDGDYKLGDFGVSKKLSDRSRATSMKGTPNYIAPEVYLGEEYDESVDLYSLGIVLYRLLNYNRNPFMPNYPDSYTSEDEDKAFELRMRGDIPNYPIYGQGELGNIVLKSISDKNNRYKTAEEFKAELEKVASSMTNEELEQVVLENVLGNVDLSSFGGNNELTHMVNDNSQNSFNSSNNSFSNSQANSISMNSQNSFSNVGQVPLNKKKSMLPIIILTIIAVAGIGFGVQFLLKGGTSTNGKFIQEDGITKFIKKNGDYAQNEWIFYNNNEYYFNGRQSLVTNDEVETNGKVYYVNNEGAKIVNDWYQTASGKKYYLDTNGEPFKNTAKNINGETVFFSDTGEIVKDDWASFEGDYYFVDSEGQMLRNSFKLSNLNEWYYLGSDGKMIANTFYDIDGKTYYFDAQGKLKMNTVFDIGDSTYYAEDDGSITKGGWTKNKQFYTDSDGRLLKNTTVDGGVKLDSNGLKIPETTVRITPTYVYDPVAPSAGTGIQNPIAPPETSGSQNSNSSIHLAATDKSSDTGNVIYSGSVDWGERLTYNDSVSLDDYGESGSARISISIQKIRDDGSVEVKAFNDVVDDLFDEIRDRALSELPYKQFNFKTTTLATCNSNEVIVNYKGEISDGSQKKNVQYKVKLDRNSTSATFTQVK